MAASRSIQALALAMSKPAVTEEKKELPASHSSGSPSPSLDHQASLVLAKYQTGIYVSGIPLWNPPSRALTETIAHFLVPGQKLLMDVNPIKNWLSFDTTLKNQIFLIFERDDDPAFDFNVFAPLASIKKEMLYENLIGVGFRFTEEVDLKTLQDLSFQMLFLMFYCNVPAFFYHPNLGLKHLSKTRLLDMDKGIASSSPLVDFEKEMRQYDIVWQKPQMKEYESFDPESCVFCFEKIAREDTYVDGYETEPCHWGGDDTPSFSFLFSQLQPPSLGPGETRWIESIIPVLQLGPKIYLDRDNKAPQLLKKRRTFYLKEIFTRFHEGFKKRLTQLAFPLESEYKIGNLNLTPDSFQNLTSIRFDFRGSKESSVELFDTTYKNNSILNIPNAYLLIRRLLHYLKIKITYSAPNILLCLPFKMKDLAISLSLHDLNKKHIVTLFKEFKARNDVLDFQSQTDLSLFLKHYLNHDNDIYYKAQVIVSILQLSSLTSHHIAYCLLWFAANMRFVDELNQLTPPTIAELRLNLSISTPIFPEITAALLVLDKITPSIPSPSPSGIESKQAMTIAPPLVVLPVPKPPKIKIEPKKEEKKEEMKKILWQGKEINPETPLAVVVQYALDQYYLKPYPKQAEKLINRPMHGGTHAIMTVLLVDLFKELFKKYYPDFLIDPLTQKNRLSDEEEKLVYLMALYHDSGNTSENQGAETDQTVHADHFYRDAIKMGFSLAAAQKCRSLMIHKDNTTHQDIEKVILHDADCLEFLRCSSKEDYDLTRLDIYHLIKNHCPNVLQAFLEDMKNIIDHYKSFLTLVYNGNVRKNFESKGLNLSEHFYTKMQEEITHYRLMRAMEPDQFRFLFFQTVSAHTKSAVHRLYASLPLVVFYSYKALDNEKIKAMYLNASPETLSERKTEEKMEKFEGAFLLRGLRGKYSEEAAIWDRNLAILREENIPDLSALRKRYDLNPLQNFRLRPATFILENVPVKSRWGGVLHILLKPSAVSFWGGFKKNVFSDRFEAKDFAFKDRLPKRIIKAATSTIFSSKVKTLETIEAIQTKLQEMDEVRRGQKLSHNYRYFGCSALDPNEVFLVNRDSLSASIEAVGICCDLTSPAWPVDVVSIAQEILMLSPSLPSKIRYFFYLPEKGLTPLSLAEISLIAQGRIQSDLRSLGLVEGLNLFNLCPVHHSQIMSPELESKEGDFENQKFGFKFMSSKGILSGHAFMRKGIPCIQVASDIYFDSTGVLRVLARGHTQLNLKAVQHLLLHFYWEMLGPYQVSDVEVQSVYDYEQQDKDVIRLSFKFFGLDSGKEVARSLLTWMGYPGAQDKLRLLTDAHLPGERISLTLSYPQALAHIQQTLTQHKETYYRELCIEEKVIETFSSWSQFSAKQKNLLNFCKLLAMEYKNPSREDAISSAINDIVPAFRDIPMGFATGIIGLFNHHAYYGWTEDRYLRLMTQFLLVLHTHSPVSMKRVLQALGIHTSDSLLFSLFSSRRLEEIMLIESASSPALEKLHRVMAFSKDYSVESAIGLVVKYAEYFSLIQLTQMLWAFVGKKNTDIKLIGREGLFKIEKRFREKEANAPLSLHVMHSLLCGKQRELETLTEEKPHSPLDGTISRKRKKLDDKEENDPKHSRSPADSSTTASP